MRLLKEPLFHFFLIGAAIFMWFHIATPESEAVENLEIITIDENDIAQLSAQFKARWKRNPSNTELQALVDASVREEVLVREARKLGLDRGDTVIRSRLSQKMNFLTEAIATSVVPDNEELDVFLKENSGRYAPPPKLAFNQIFLGENPSPAEIESVLSALRTGQEPSNIGGSTLLPPTMPLTVMRVVDSVFGAGFANGLMEVELGEWSGPVESGYGVHLVEVIAIEQSRIPPLVEIHDAVLRDWRRAKGEELAQTQYETLVDRYEIVAPDLSGSAE